MMLCHWVVSRHLKEHCAFTGNRQAVHEDEGTNIPSKYQKTLIQQHGLMLKTKPLLQLYT